MFRLWLKSCVFFFFLCEKYGRGEEWSLSILQIRPSKQAASGISSFWVRGRRGVFSLSSSCPLVSWLCLPGLCLICPAGGSSCTFSYWHISSLKLKAGSELLRVRWNSQGGLAPSLWEQKRPALFLREAVVLGKLTAAWPGDLFLARGWVIKADRF